ncbi:MAG TPA: hypothetical protein VGM82_20015 [Gemmatimonadaceae bacterium]|jgi:hypothetical protein
MRLNFGMLIAACVTIAACSNDTASPTLGKDKASSAAAPATSGDTTGSGSPSTPTPTVPEPTSTNPVATIAASPTTLALAQGAYSYIDVVARDAAGVRVSGRRATWTVDDANVVAVSDTGVVYGKAVGSTSVHATIDGHTASVAVTVAAAQTPPASTPTPVSQPAVASFDLMLTIGGALAGTDTSRNEIVVGATVHLLRTGGTTGDTLATSIDAGTATTSADGVVSFRGLAGGWYTIDITPPAGSPYAPMHTGMPAPRLTDMRMKYVLLRK